jgi:hypothetical protein
MAFTRPRASQINFDTTNITDTLIRINSSESGDNTNDLGIIFERGNHTNAAIVWDESADAFRFISTTHDASTTTSDINISAHHSLHVGVLAASSLILDGTTVTATATELNYVDGVSSNIQTQIDNISSSFTLAADSGTTDTFTTGETLTFTGSTGIDTTVSNNNISIAIDSTVATQSYVTTQISNLVDSAPSTLDTLNELAAALGDDANFATTTATSLGEKLVKASNLSDLTNAATARTNLGLGTAATTATTAYATAAQGALADSATQPSDNISTLTNNSGYITASTADTLTNKTLTSPSVNTEAKMLAQAELEFYDSDSSNYVSFRGPATVASNITWTLPDTDGTDGQMLSTNGAGTLAWADGGGGGGGGGSSYPNSTFTTVPGTDGNFDMSFNVAQTSQETPFEAGGTDAFGVNLGSVFNCMDPIGTTENIDYATGEAYVGA